MYGCWQPLLCVEFIGFFSRRRDDGVCRLLFVSVSFANPHTSLHRPVALTFMDFVLVDRNMSVFVGVAACHNEEIPSPGNSTSLRVAGKRSPCCDCFSLDSTGTRELRRKSLYVSGCS